MFRIIFIIFFIISCTSKFNNDLKFNDIKCLENISYRKYIRTNQIPAAYYYFIRFDNNNQPVRCLMGN